MQSDDRNWKKPGLRQGLMDSMSFTPLKFSLLTVSTLALVNIPPIKTFPLPGNSAIL